MARNDYEQDKAKDEQAASEARSATMGASHATTAVAEPPAPAETEDAPKLHPKEQARLDIAADIETNDQAAKDAALVQALTRVGGSIRVEPSTVARVTHSGTAITVKRDGNFVYVQLAAPE